MSTFETLIETAKTLDCIHCGLCLQSCPTYRVLGREPSSPRGRIHLMRAIAEERVEFDATAHDELHLCLGCRACETVCPAGVRYGEMLEEARAEGVRRGLTSGRTKLLQRVMLGWLFRRPGRMRLAANAMRVGQSLGLVSLGKWMATRGLLPKRLREIVPLAPSFPPRRSFPESVPAIGDRRGRVGMLLGCVQRELFPNVQEQTARMLAAHGYDVVMPKEQVCCGALHSHAGRPELARELAKDNLGAFEDDLDAIVVNAAGCGASMRLYGHLLPDDPRAARFADRVRDISEVLAEGGVRSGNRPIAKRIAYHPPCHLLHGQKVSGPPEAILQAIPGAELVPLPNADHCCGSAGIYNLTHPEMANELLKLKIEAIRQSGAEIVATGNPGCHLQIEAGLREAGLDIRVAHPVTLLAETFDK
ncbi:MAG: heterodisulfide reductase-related iron-sulfur binding cluster [Planctomycetota bacterium]